MATLPESTLRDLPPRPRRRGRMIEFCAGCACQSDVESCPSMSPPSQSRQERSEHEAGHFFLLFVQRVPHIPGFITIESYREEAEGTNFCQLPPRLWQLPEQLGMYYLAGMVAQTEGLIRRGTPITSHVRRRIEEAGAGDIHSFADLKLGNRENYESRTRRIIMDNWSAVEALSLELQERGTLFHEEPALVLAIAMAENPELKELIAAFLERYRKCRQKSESGTALEVFRSRYPGTAFLESVPELIARRHDVFRDLQETLSKFELRGIPYLQDIVLWKGSPSQLKSKILLAAALVKARSWLPW